MDDPLLLAATALAFTIIPMLSFQCSKKQPGFTFIPPIIGMVIAFPMFFFVMLVPTLPISKPLFIISMSLWTGGLFGFFFAIIIYIIKRKK